MVCKANNRTILENHDKIRRRGEELTQAEWKGTSELLYKFMNEITYRDYTATNRVFEAVHEKGHVVCRHGHCSLFNRKRTTLDGFAVTRHGDWIELKGVVEFRGDLSVQYSYLHSRSLTVNLLEDLG